MSWGNPWFAVDFPTNPLIATIFETNPLVIWRGPGQTGNRRCRKDRKSYDIHGESRPTFMVDFPCFFGSMILDAYWRVPSRNLT
jgi:hypothetical protein